MTTVSRVLFTSIIAIVISSSSMEVFASTFNHIYNLDGSHISRILNFSKKWSSLEPSIRFFKRMSLPVDSYEE
uniref:Secreted protein n=1 Tax=Haemonchus contortus TaxID=6289 RepID=A0A7I4Z300_HAECO